MHLDRWVIDALEADDYLRIGPTVYAKGHLKKYAALLGLPAAEILAGFESARPRGPTPGRAVPACCCGRATMRRRPVAYRSSRSAQALPSRCCSVSCGGGPGIARAKVAERAAAGCSGARGAGRQAGRIRPWSPAPQPAARPRRSVPPPTCCGRSGHRGWHGGHGACPGRRPRAIAFELLGGFVGGHP